MNETEMNDGVQIILNRMKTNPEEFFDEGGRWKWIFKDTLREVLTEIEKAAIFEGLKQVRRAEITAKAASTVLRADEQIEKDKESYPYDQSPFSAAPLKREGSAVNYNSPFTFATTGGTQQATLTLGQEQINEDDIREIKKLTQQKMLKDILK